MRLRLTLVVLLSCLVLPAVLSAEEPPPEAAAEAPPEDPGCRAPSEEGCATCCRPVDGGKCTRLSWTGGPQSKAKPWYNSQRALAKPCPDDCKPCAKCLERDAETLAKLKAPEGCDCEAIEIGVDPCHAPMSCACFCSRYLRLSELCPG